MKTFTSKISSVLTTLSAAAMLALGATGCLVTDDLDPVDVVYVDPGPAADVAKVTIDPGATMSVEPGAGVGLFVQYDEGGHWTVFTTCDTDYSGNACDFDVMVYETGARTTIANVEGFELDADDTFTTDADGSINLVTETTFGMNGMFFDTAPGAEIEIDVLIDGIAQPQFVYAVSGGRLIDGVRTNPVDFLPATP
jgi:hypothetical protein